MTWPLLWSLGLAAVVAAGALAVADPPPGCGKGAGAAPVLVVRRAGTPALLLPLQPGETVALRFVHSVDGLPVEDRYAVAPGAAGLIQTETRFLSIGTGMGLIPGEGRPVEQGRWLRVTEMHRPIGTLALRVGTPGVDHTLVYRGCDISLTRRWAGQRVTLEAVWVPAWMHGLLDAGGRLFWLRSCRP